MRNEECSLLNTREPLPPPASCTLQPVSVTWDAIRVPRGLGLSAVAILGPRCGAVVDDPTADLLFWFVAPGSAAGWNLDGTRALTSRRHTVAIPPLRLTRGPGPHWLVCPGDEGWLTDVRALKAALEDCLPHATDKTDSASGEAETR